MEANNQDNKLLRILHSGAVPAAQSLLGWRLYVLEPSGERIGGAITETEAYTQEDAASHTFKGQTLRNSVMFGPAGYFYVYFTYGMHWCANLVTGEAGHGEGVLLRSIKPDHGLEVMRERRKGQPDPLLCNGPAKLCQALTITGADNGAPVQGGRFELLPPTSSRITITATPRIGIKHDTHRLWRFVSTEAAG